MVKYKPLMGTHLSSWGPWGCVGYWHFGGPQSLHPNNAVSMVLQNTGILLKYYMTSQPCNLLPWWQKGITIQHLATLIPVQLHASMTQPISKWDQRTYLSPFTNDGNGWWTATYAWCADNCFIHVESTQISASWQDTHFYCNCHIWNAEHVSKHCMHILLMFHTSHKSAHHTGGGVSWVFPPIINGIHQPLNNFTDTV